MRSKRRRPSPVVVQRWACRPEPFCRVHGVLPRGLLTDYLIVGMIRHSKPKR